jgi:hypothetical protein
MIDIDSGVKKLFKLVQHTANFEWVDEKISIEEKYSHYLSELRLLEIALHNKNLV